VNKSCCGTQDERGDFIKLNLGCGQNLLAGYVNVDKFGAPDVRHDLEIIPWPWKKNSVSEVVLNHALEHLGETTAKYLEIIRELYRVCAPEALIFIVVPHPRHDHFFNDPTHVRIITPDSLGLFSKKKNLEWDKTGCANSPLGLFLDVDFELVKSRYVLDPSWEKKLKDGEYSNTDIYHAISTYNNVIQEIHVVLRVVK